MKRLFCSTMLALMLGLLAAGSASATTYYIAANGSDSNSGTSQNSPWLHAPGMINCSSNCAAARPTGGDSIIFRGGDSWHWGNESSSPATGGKWDLFGKGIKGSSGNCNLDSTAGAIATSSCLYFGVDTGWFSGSSFTRPIFTMDNPATTNIVSSCKYANDGMTAIFVGADTIFDNFEFTGNCWTASTGAWITMAAAQIEITNSYFHGWSSSNTDDTWHEVGYANPGFFLIDHDVFDGTDSTEGTTPHHATGFALAGCPEVRFSVFRQISNGCIDGGATGSYPGVKSIHDNRFELMFNPNDTDGTHGNVIEELGPAVGDILMYNNIFTNSGNGEGFDLFPANGGTVYYFNNIAWNIGNGVNCVMLEGSQTSAGNKIYMTNNTWDFQANVQGSNNGGCMLRFLRVTNGPNTAFFQNNHFINYSNSSLSSVVNGSGNVTDNGNEIWQSESTANSQGYTPSNSYQPNSTSGATIHAGSNMSGDCQTFSTDSALCKGSTGGVTTSAGVAVPFISSPPSRGSTFDAGAYQFGSGSSSSPAAPSGLSANVQ